MLWFSLLLVHGKVYSGLLLIKIFSKDILLLHRSKQYQKANAGWLKIEGLGYPGTVLWIRRLPILGGALIFPNFTIRVHFCQFQKISLPLAANLVGCRNLG